MEPYWTDGKRTIYHGDCREVLPTLGRFDLLLTDPPYGIGSLMKGGKNTGHWESLSDGNSWDMELPDVSQIPSMCDASIIWGGNYFGLPASRCWFAWKKNNAVPTQADMELAWTSLDMPARCFEYPSGGAYKRVHPTQKPLPLMRWCISFAPNAKTILDPFMGSGTTLVAAKLEGLEAVGIELSEKYCEAAVKRLQQNTLEFVDG